MENGERAFHEAAAIFPMMEGEEFDELVQDIKANGLHMPIELYEDRILDGRNRYRACLEAGVEPKYDNVSPPDPVAYVLSKNLHRRHLTASQRAMAAARGMRLYEQRAKERQRIRKGDQPGATVEKLPQKEAGKTRDKAGELVGVSGKSIDHAKTVLRKGQPALIKAVDEGKMAVSRAAEVAKEPAEKQVAAVKEATEQRVDQSTKQRARRSRPASAKTAKPDQLMRLPNPS